MKVGRVTGADLRAALEASCLRGALPPVDLRAVCYLVSITKNYQNRADSDPKDDTLVRAIRTIKNQSKTLRFDGESSCFECGCDVVIYVCECNSCRSGDVGCRKSLKMWAGGVIYCKPDKMLKNRKSDKPTTRKIWRVGGGGAGMQRDRHKGRVLGQSEDASSQIT